MKRALMYTTYFFSLTVLAAFIISSQVEAQAGLPPLTSYNQNFDGLATTGTSNTSLPTGWTILESGRSSRVNQQYAAGTGSSSTGDTYSFGSVASTERAFGELSSGTIDVTIGIQFQNNTGGTVGKLVIQYQCEQWRRGTAANGTDRLDFQYSVDATSLSTGVWTDFDTLDCVDSATTGSSAIDGNTNRESRSGTVSGLTISDGNTFWIRWVGNDVSGSDHGLAIDDFEMNEQDPNTITLSSLAANTTGKGQFAQPMFGLIILGAGIFALRRKARI